MVAEGVVLHVGFRSYESPQHEHAAAEGEGMGLISDITDERCRFLIGTVQIVRSQSPCRE